MVLPGPEHPSVCLFVKPLLCDKPLLVEWLVLGALPIELAAILIIYCQAIFLHNLGSVSVRESVVVIAGVVHIVSLLRIWMNRSDGAANIVMVVKSETGIVGQVGLRVPCAPKVVHELNVKPVVCADGKSIFCCTHGCHRLWIIILCQCVELLLWHASLIPARLWFVDDFD